MRKLGSLFKAFCQEFSRRENFNLQAGLFRIFCCLSETAPFLTFTRRWAELWKDLYTSNKYLG